MTTAVSPAATPTLRELRWWDLQAVLAIEGEVFAPESWSAEVFWSELAQLESRHYVVAELGGEVVGYAGLAAVGDEGYVQTIGVRDAHQGRGIGRLLLGELLREVSARGCRTCGLEVRVSGEPAQGLYRSEGFVPVGVRRGYYERTGEDAVVMVRRTP